MILQRTPLYDSHRALKAKIVPFGGWEMPVQYDGILAEYGYTRRAAAVFDICHMGEFIIEGDCVDSGLDRVVTQRITDLPVGACRYGAMLNDQGGVRDDLIVFRLETERWMAVVNAATTEKDLQHIRQNLRPGAVLKDISRQTGKLDLQGPESRDLLKTLIPGIEQLAYYSVAVFDLFGDAVLVSRTGYTGELGYEVYLPWEKAARFWDALLAAGARPAGLGARDVLRLEMGYPLYGHEMDEDICALECGLGRFIDWNKDFIGKSALVKYKENGMHRDLICFASESRRSPRAGQKIFSANKECVGSVSSGTFSPALERGAGLGFVTSRHESGDNIFFGDETCLVPARIVSRPIYKNGSLKSS